MREHDCSEQVSRERNGTFRHDLVRGDADVLAKTVLAERRETDSPTETVRLLRIPRLFVTILSCKKFVFC